MPVTFYQSVNDIPPFDDYGMAGRTYRYFNGEQLFAFGHGLSYRKFDYSGLTTDSPTVKPGKSVKISVVVTNSGSYDGDEVVQVYLSQPESITTRPIKSLIAFQRVHIKKGETREVSLIFAPEQLRYYDNRKGDYSIASGNFEFLVGAASDDIRGPVTVEGL